MPPREKTVTVSLKMTPKQQRQIDRAAQACGMSRQAWCKAVLDCASGTSPLAVCLDAVRS